MSLELHLQLFRKSYRHCRRDDHLRRLIRLSLIVSLDENHNLQGDPHVAVDDKFAGPGDTVFLVGSREAALACEPTFVPVDAAVVGFVDRVNSEGDQ